MSTPLLRTKLFIPPPRPSLMARPRLVERLDEGLRLGHRLTLTSAPAGFGKTTLLSAWVRHADRAAAWLSLDEGDNDPGRFMAYLLAALQLIDANIGRTAQTMLRAQEPLPLEPLLTGLTNDITASSQPLILVLDDYHVIEAAPIHEVLSFLLDHLSPPERGVHLVIATRTNPPLPIARLRARGQLTELRAADLRFTPAEAAAYLNETLKVALPGEHVAALQQRTEGWITGLRLAAASLQRREDAVGSIEAFNGSRRHMLDYLTEEVLNEQPKELRAFLLQTAILDRLAGPLCNAVTEQTQSQLVLEQLEADNLFIVPLDEEQRWYRYHHIFADLLRQRLDREQKQQVPKLHRRAAAWYESEGMLPEAVHHLLAAGDSTRAAELIDWTGWELLARGEVQMLLGWFETLPQDLLNSHPQLGVLRNWALVLAGRWRGLERTMLQEDNRHAAGEVNALHAYLASLQGDLARTIELSGRALDLLPEHKWFSRSAASLSLGLAHFANGKLTQASEALNDAIALGGEAGPTYTTLAATIALGQVQEMRASLHQAASTFQGALELAARQGVRPVPITGMAQLGLAGLQYEWNDLDQAFHTALKGIDLSELGGFTGYMLSGYVRLIQVHLARKNLEAASRALGTAENLGQTHNYPYAMGVLAKVRVRLWVEQGNLAAASEWLQRCVPRLSEEFSWRPATPVTRPFGHFASEANHLAAVRVLLALNQPSEALSLLAPVLAAAETDGRTASLIEALVLQALGYQAEADTGQALLALERVLAHAAPEGYERTFVDEGKPMAVLLRRALVQGIMPSYAGRLLLALGDTPQRDSPGAQALVDPLTKRELQVLRLVAAGLSNPEIARELVIAVSTVKSHINHSYTKLGVKNRMMAVNRARALNLL